MKKEFYVYFLNNGKVKCGNPMTELHKIDDRFTIYCSNAENRKLAIEEYLDSLNLPKFVREKIKIEE